MRARAMYARRNDPRPPPTPFENAMYELLSLDYDVLGTRVDDAEKRIFDAYLGARDDRLLWMISYTTGRDRYERIEAFYADVDSVRKFSAPSWEALRELLEGVAGSGTPTAK